MRDSTHTYLTLYSLFLTRTAIKTRLPSIVRRGEQRISLVDLEGRLQIIPDFGILQRRNLQLFRVSERPTVRFVHGFSVPCTGIH